MVKNKRFSYKYIEKNDAIKYTVRVRVRVGFDHMCS